MELSPFKISTPRLTLAGLKNGAKAGSPIIAIHGWLDNAASFMPLSASFDTDRPFYALELPGHGHSDHRSEASTYHLVENIVDVLAFLYEVCGAEANNVTLIGHSMGGIVCSLLAAAAPERFDKLILLDSLGPMTDSNEGVLPRLQKAASKYGAFKRSKKAVFPTKEMAIAVRMGGIGKVSKDAAELLVERGSKPVEGGVSWTSDPSLLGPSLVRFSEEQIKAIFSGIECPVQLICGDEGYFSSYKALSGRLDYIANQECHHVSGGHHFHMDGDVAKTAELIHDFIT